ncbi:hypothetical protein Ddye_012410 [Dipteronia dyeriana]|uniref:Uncharacterized protein n=1 Tax=Dipteronia dyeriana TaxID=168575 RepID=A0AAE0CIL9_9ROSI|nr:hypothetical protein Ddye_012410 [Dipteronia dyeriana]
MVGTKLASCLPTYLVDDDGNHDSGYFGGDVGGVLPKHCRDKYPGNVVMYFYFIFYSYLLGLKMVKRRKQEQKNGGAHKTTTTTTISKPEIGNMGWTHYFQNVTTEEAQHRDIPKKFNLPPPYEEIPGTDLLLGIEEIIATRCNPSRWTWIAKNLSEEQKEVVRILSFGNLLTLNCGHLHLRICCWLVDNFYTAVCSIHIHGRRFPMNSNLFGRVLGIFD